MTMVTIKKVNRKTSISRETASKAAREVIEKIGKPKSLKVRVKFVDNPVGVPAKKAS